MQKRKLISFDWALKRLLRSKANFAVLEGFLSELLREEITILEILESESNQEDAEDKFNRVDLKVKNKKEEIIIIEIQYEQEFDYLQRILYATSKAITEQLMKSEPYHKVVKVFSINILYFDLGHGKDYVYRGSTRFEGIHKKDTLELTALFGKQMPSEIYPEYYLIKVNQFDDIAKDRLDEWIYFLKNEEIKEEFSAKGIKEAKKILDVMKLSDEERLSYEKYVENRRYEASMFFSSYEVGHLNGRKEGKSEGRIAVAKLMKNNQEPIEKIVQYTHLTVEEVSKL